MSELQLEEPWLGGWTEEPLLQELQLEEPWLGGWTRPKPLAWVPLGRARRDSNRPKPGRARPQLPPIALRLGTRRGMLQVAFAT